MGRPPGPAYYVGVTPVGSGARRPSLGLILPPTTQGELVPAPVLPQVVPLVPPGAPPELAELCRRAEATGADSLWAVDHLFWPHPMGEALTTLAVAAVATSRPTLGTCVLQLPLRRPAAVAKQATALQLLSGGRFVLGLGVGIHEGEYERAGVDFHRRGRLMDEGVAELRAAWDGPTGRPGRSDYVQEPASPPVPLWFGGSSAAARRRAAAVGDGWVPLFLAPDEYAAGAGGAAARDGRGRPRPRRPSRPAVVVFACVGDDDEAPGARRGLALAPLPAAAQGLPAPPGGRIARDVRRRAARASPTPGPATSSSWWPGRPPSSTSPCCAPRSPATSAGVLAGVPA